MIKSNLIEAIRTLSPKEMKELGEFVSSPFFNKNKNVIKLFEIVRKYYPVLDSDKLQKENVFNKLFPGEPYKDSSIRLLMFYLYEVIEKFLAYQRFTRNEFDYKRVLLAEFNERELLKNFEKTYNEVMDMIKGQKVRDEEYFTDCFFVASEHYNYLSKVHLEKYDKYMTGENIDAIFNNLTYSYLIRVLRFYAAILNTEYVLNHKISTRKYESMLSSFDPAVFKEVPLADIYYRLTFLLLRPDEEENYFALKNLVLENEEMIGPSGLGDIYVNLENYCTRRVRAGKMHFLKENFDFYKLELEKGMYKMNNYMSSAFYRSIVNVGCRLKEYDFLKEFIEKYKDELREDVRDCLYKFCCAIIETDLGNYEKALELVSKVKTDELYLKMDIRMLQCRLYYQLDWDDSLNSLMDAFRRTLGNNKLIPDMRKQHYFTFLKYLAKLNNLRHKGDELEFEMLLKQINAEESFYNKAWMQNKIEGMIAEYAS